MEEEIAAKNTRTKKISEKKMKELERLIEEYDEVEK